MLSNLKIGKLYKRVDLDGIFSTNRFSQSREGIVSIDDHIVLFCTLEKELKKEQFHYNDYFDGHYFRWDSQNPQTISTPRIQRMVQGTVEILLFCRLLEKIRGQSQPFVYCGRLKFYEHYENTAKPVHLIFEASDYQEKPNKALQELYEWQPGGDKPSSSRKPLFKKQISKKVERLTANELKSKVRSEHLFAALVQLRNGKKTAFASSRDYDVVIDEEETYAPKELFGLAATLALGFEIKPEHFSGGEDSTCHDILKREGYKIVSKSNKDKEQLKNYTEEDKKWVEGKPRLVKHLKKERASGLAKAKKDSFVSIHGYLFCERCKVNPKEVYGPFGESCLKVHHCKTTVSRMDEDHVTDLEDL